MDDTSDNPENLPKEGDKENDEKYAMIAADFNERLTNALSLLIGQNEDRFFSRKVGRYYPFPFFVDEEILNKAKDQILESLQLINKGGEINFSSSTRFQDLSSISHQSYDDFLKKAGDKKDPESAVLQWTLFQFSYDQIPFTGKVEITLVTEKSLDSDDNYGKVHRAHIGLLVSGSNQEWAQKTFSDIAPILEAAKLGGVYKPLWIFRNPVFNSIASNFLGFLGLGMGMHLAFLLTSNDVSMSKSEHLDRILEAPDSTSKLDILSNYILDGNSSPWTDWLLSVVVGGVCYALAFGIANSILPKLAPASAIAVGLANRRAKEQHNLFKFIVFTVVVGGLLVPLFLEFFKALF